jgi:hypothetical protein
LYGEKTGKRTAFRFFEAPTPDLQRTILEIVPRIDRAAIFQIIQVSPYMSVIRKQAIIESIKMWYNQVILLAFIKLRYSELTVKERLLLLSQAKNRNNADMRKYGYIPLNVSN